MSSVRKWARGLPPRKTSEGTPADPRRITTDKHALDWMKSFDNREAVREVCGGLSRQAVLQWKKIPVVHCPALEKAFGIPRAVMRPDIYG